MAQDGFEGLTERLIEFFYFNCRYYFFWMNVVKLFKSFDF
jgi:hypothetical protein